MSSPAAQLLAESVRAFLSGQSTTTALASALATFDGEQRLKERLSLADAMCGRPPRKLPPFESLFKPGAWCTYQEVIEQYSRALYDALAKALS